MCCFIFLEDLEEVMVKVNKKRKAPLKKGGGSSKKAKKRGVKRKNPQISDENAMLRSSQIDGEKNIFNSSKISKTEHELSKSASIEKPLNVMEISPFEQVSTYKCQYCSKRSNILEKLEIHLKVDHSNKNSEEQGYKILTRDQVVDLLTLNLTSTTGEGAQFICYYCEDVVGTIHELKTHFTNEHTENQNDVNAFKVKRVTDAKKNIPGTYRRQIHK